MSFWTIISGEFSYGPPHTAVPYLTGSITDLETVIKSSDLVHLLVYRISLF